MRQSITNVPPVPLDQVLVSFELDHETESVRVFVRQAAHAKTGVEMEALAGANAALLCIWDLCKGTDPVLRISGAGAAHQDRG